MYDLYTKGEEGVWSHGNHHFPTFKADPLDDTEVLRRVWKILDSAEVIVAHNARFDKGWLMGRFLELGWTPPSMFKVVCTYQNLYEYNMTSKKLDELSQKLIGTQKITTDFNLWMRCSKGDKKAFEEMIKYNIGDIYQTLYKVYVYTCQYYPHKCVDFTDYDSETPQCRTSGRALEKLAKRHRNHNTGLTYYMFRNPINGLVYRDRHNTKSKNANTGKIMYYR
jgi:DNA polymerase III epsilon subunit-like protein